ncbi:hypothetical protein QVD17_36830 [Tagetes erecta]|uniref:Uncharacterized protein n=1 Tax=Tagetes erecta TaxID=13708 RepID=A0AAD8NC75_TARER|nr:hypothetical protein QVD17_36830 [Tagetes erecta]
MPTINSRDFNYLVYRYLQESGLEHTAYNMECEAGIDNENNVNAKLVQAGALVTLVQKGFRFLEMEALAEIDDQDVGEVFSVVKPFDLLTMTVDEVKKIVEERKIQELEKQRKGKGKEVDVVRVSKDKQKEKMHAKAYSLSSCENLNVLNEYQCEKKFPLLRLVITSPFKRTLVVLASIVIRALDWTRTKNDSKQFVDTSFHGPEPMDMSSSLPPPVRGVRSSDVLTLQGHTAEVYTCVWSPAGFLLASGSGDATARIWRLAEKTSSSSLINRLADERVLMHSMNTPSGKGKEVTTLDWNFDGSLLATGSHDGLARIWNTNGELKGIFKKHTAPVHSVNWNKTGDCLLTGSFDGTAIVWDANACECKQQFNFHSGAILDVDWRTNRTFASCSVDTMIHVNKVGENRPLKTFSGHSEDVNCIKWNASGSLLASCSNDMTVKIWSMKPDMPIHDFKDHAKEVYVVGWSPTGPATNNPNKQLLLASASFDSTVKLWDVEAGKLFHSLNGHRDAVYTISFSPNGEYLASGSADKMVNIWSVKECKIIKTYFGNGIVSHVSWNKEGNQIAYSTHKKCVRVSDFRK